MGALQEFERRLEGAVEGFFARAFRSGLQPIELAKALQRYAEDSQAVTAGGVIVPNVYRFRLSPKDSDRLTSFGDALGRELGEVVARTASERGWLLRGPVHVVLERDEAVKYGMYELAGKVEAAMGAPVAARRPSAAPAAPATPAAPPAPPATAVPDSGGARYQVVLASGEAVALSRSRVTLGRLPTCDVVVDETTVSREHAALVRRSDDEWWIVDLGSTNGTSVNGARVTEQPLTPGDRITLGDVPLQFGAL